MQKMKYKVLAADDEYWSRENLRSLISWEDYAIKFLDPACDGEEVLERIKEEKPDIILTDINMPFLDGLELLKKLQTEYPQIITIAVSGYDDFEKVKGVFVSGGLDYLLKPVGKEELVRILTKALGILEERETLRRNTETNRQKEHKLSSFMEDSEYSALLSGKLYGQFQAQPHVSSTGEFSGMAALMVKFYNIAEIAEKFDHDSLQMSLDIKTKLRKLTDGDPDAIIFNNCNKMSEFLIFTSLRTKSLQIFAEKILKEFPLDDYGPVSVILHEQTGSLDDIGNIYRDMIAVLVTRPFTYTHCILSCPEGESTSACQTVGKNISHRIEEELYHFLNTSQKNETRKLIFQTCDFRNCDNGSWSCLDVKQYIRRITGILYRYVQEQQPELTAQAEEAMDDIDYYMKCLDADSVMSSIKILLNSLWENDSENNADSAGSQVEQIRQYILTSYHENITLTALASAYHMDASYLSRMFSQTYGETIIAYLTRVRMEQAIRLMGDEEKKLETISFLVGYDDYNYFSRVFRKKLGVSPREYRNNICK
ncbi:MULTISPECIES: response regulator [Blautia]|uniref:response regulator n=1 Tax=Blautia TaxID=572511 RepID=UPI00136DD734|nr:response regulator [Blautia sp. BIOML-A1]MZT65834.1 response regulator [Blautia sp. BIOML-A1]